MYSSRYSLGSMAVPMNSVNRFSQNGCSAFKYYLPDFTFQFAIYIVLGFATLQDSDALSLIGVILGLIHCFTGKIDSLFCFVCGLSIYEYSYRIGVINVNVLPVCIIVFRLLLENRLVVFRSRSALFATYLVLLLELFGDLQYGSKIELAMTLVYFVFFAFTAMNIELLVIDVFKLYILFSLPVVTSIFFMLLTYGSPSGYFALLFTSSGLYRFGIGDANLMGGAMSLPLYCTMMLAISLSYYITTKHVSPLKVALFFILDGFCLFFAVMTISRSLYLCLLAIGLGVLLGEKKHRNRKIIKLTLSMFFILICGIIAFWNIITQAVELLLMRVVTDTDGAGRLDVWISCLDYASRHPLSILLGNGACRYPSLDEGLNAGAHNLYLDMFMSWGIIGAALVLYLTSNCMRRIKKRYGKIDIMACLPLFAFFSFALTAMRSSSLKTWSFALVCLVVVQMLSLEKE